MDYKIIVAVAASVVAVAGCKEKKVHDDIIAPKVETRAPSAPVRMQEYKQTRDVFWLGRNYKVEIRRVADDSLRMVKDETGQKFVDNRITLVVRRADGSVAVSKTFLKATFDAFLDSKYRAEGILEGLVFDDVDNQQLSFAASVCLPQTDEFIPLEVKINSDGNLSIKRDSVMDTNGDGNPADAAAKQDDDV